MIAIKDKMEEQLKEGFSEKEIQQLYGYLERIKDNLMRDNTRRRKSAYGKN